MKIKPLAIITAFMCLAACHSKTTDAGTVTGSPTTSPTSTATQQSAQPTKGPAFTVAPVTPAPGATATSGSGAEGAVRAGPTCPVERPGRPCPPRTVNDATVTAKDTSGHIAATTHTDHNGSYRLMLDPGTYDISAASRSVFGCRSQSVRVVAHRYTNVTIICDTGIR